MRQAKKNFFNGMGVLLSCLISQFAYSASSCEVSLPGTTQVGECRDSKGQVHPFVILGPLKSGLTVKEIEAFVLFGDLKTESLVGINPEKVMPMSKKWGVNAYMTQIGRKTMSRRISFFNITFQGADGIVSCMVPPGIQSTK